MNPEAEKNLALWLRAPYDSQTQSEIRALLKSNPTEVEEAFSSELKFGTGGLRAKMGLGPGRMNKYTIRIVTQGLANYIKTFPEKAFSTGVVICHDSRLHSREFAQEAACVLAANEIPVHLVTDLRPTPFVSFAVRHYKAIAGINITASHNPKEYNGYKVYWADGGQVVPPHDELIIHEVEKVDLSHVKHASLNDKRISPIPLELDEAFIDAVFNLSIHKDFLQIYGKELSIVYSPLNGAGITLIPRALKRCGFLNVHLVEEQKHPDGNFPTTPYPNPEIENTLALGMRDLVQLNADILLVSDPDADRLSCTILHKGQPRRLTGNELGILLLHYLIKNRIPQGKWATVTSIVSTDLIRKITQFHYGQCFEVLTGFKYIGEKIDEWEKQENGYQFFFGMEESLGYLAGTYTRDKDAVAAATLTAEMAVRLKKNGKTLIDELYAIFTEYGIHREDQTQINAEDRMPFLLTKIESLRTSPPKTLCSIPVIKIDDYLTSLSTDCLTHVQTPIQLPKENVLSFYLADQSKFLIRPSGTEPKIKIYGQMVSPSTDFPSIEEGLEILTHRLQTRLTQIKDILIK